MFRSICAYLLQYARMAIEIQGNRQGQHPDTPKAPALGEQQTTEQLGNQPPLHPIWERAAQTLAKQQAEKHRDKLLPLKVSDFLTQEEPAFSSQQDPVAREKFLEKFKRRRDSQAAWMRNYRRRQKEARMREQTDASSDPSVMPPAPESAAMAHPRRTSGRKSPRV
jgi:hypothetical protein